MDNKLVDLNEIQVFLKVVQTGSFSEAARQLQMPKSTVSAKVAGLEKRLGVSLIRRTTRKLFVTDPGKAYAQSCGSGLEEILRAEDQLSMDQSEPQGHLRLTAPLELGSAVSPELVAACRKKYPKVSLEIHLGDRTVDLIGEGYDLALRAGHLKDSSLIAKKLGEVQFSVFATRQYLKGRPVPKHPRDLKDHVCLQFTPFQEGWRLTNGKSTLTHRPTGGTITINDLNTLKSLCLSHQGLALLPTFLCRSETHKEQLQLLMSDWKSEVRPLHFVYPAHKFLPPKLSAFIETSTPILKKWL